MSKLLDNLGDNIQAALDQISGAMEALEAEQHTPYIGEALLLLDKSKRALRLEVARLWTLASLDEVVRMPRAAPDQPLTGEGHGDEHRRAHQ